MQDRAASNQIVPGTNQQIDKFLTRPDSRPVRYRLVSPEGPTRDGSIRHEKRRRPPASFGLALVRTRNGPATVGMSRSRNPRQFEQEG